MTHHFFAGLARALAWVFAGTRGHKSGSKRTFGKNGRLLLGNGAMLVVVLFWGTSFISIKTTLGSVPPVTMALLRFAIAASILWLLLRKLEPASRLERRDRLRMAGTGFLGVTLYFFFENTGVKHTSVSNAALITSLIPVIAASLDFCFHRVRITMLQAAAMMVAFSGGILAVTAKGDITWSSGQLGGNLLIVCAMVCWACFTVATKSVPKHYSGLLVTAWQNLYGTLFLLPLSLTEVRQWEPLSLTAALNIVYLALFCSAGCYLLYNFVLRTLGVAATTLYLNLVPIVGVASGHFWMGDRILPAQLLGGALIFTAILLVNAKALRLGSSRPDSAKSPQAAPEPASSCEA